MACLRSLRPAGGLLAAAALAGTLLAGGTWRGAAVRAAAPDQAGEPRTTLLDDRALGLFDATTPLRGLQVRYRLDARVLIPLGFASVPLWSRADVGWMDASYRDRPADEESVLRGYELFVASRPERARGLNRLGFFREALRINGGAVGWTAYFGTMSASREESYGEATKAVEAGQPHVYDVTDGLVTPLHARASLFKVASETREASAAALYDILRPRLGKPVRTPSVEGTPARPLPVLAFLGALEATLTRAAHAPATAKGLRVGFVHNGSVKQLEISSIKRDARRSLPAPFVRNLADVFVLDYRITSPKGTDGTFKIWAEFPSGRRPENDEPIPPIAWEFQPRSFLRLHAERTR